MPLLLASLIIAALLVGLYLMPTARIDRVLRSAVHLIGVSLNMPLSQVICIIYRVAALVWHYLLGIAPDYWHELM